jgi:putative membrane protein insertion efficiency factor
MLRKIFAIPIIFYQKIISPILLVLGFKSECCYFPTCSDYTLSAIKKFGPIKGSFLGLKRISRCHSCSEVTHDPLP